MACTLWQHYVKNSGLGGVGGNGGGKEEKADPKNILTSQRLSSSVFLDFRIVLYPWKICICDTLGIKSGHSCSIFSKLCIFDGSWARSDLHSDFWDVQNIRRDFSEANISVRRPKIILGNDVLAPEFLYDIKICIFKHIPFDKLEPNDSKES